MSELSLYYDFSCPWSYLALVRLRDVADRNATTVELRPVNVDAILATENPALREQRLADNPAKQAWQKADLDEWAQFWGLRIQLPEAWPHDSSLAAAAAAVAIGQGAGLAFSLKLYEAHFGAGQSLTDVDALSELAKDCGVNVTDFPAALETATRQTEDWGHELIRKGGFGTPTTFVGERVYFGNDRIPLVEWRLGPVSDDNFVMPGQHGGPV